MNEVGHGVVYTRTYFACTCVYVRVCVTKGTGPDRRIGEFRSPEPR